MLRAIQWDSIAFAGSNSMYILQKMDIVNTCKTTINEKIKELKSFIESQECLDGSNKEEYTQTQSLINSPVVDRDRNLDKILDQQLHIKTIIERDNLIRALRRSIASDTEAIESFRRKVSKIAVDAMKTRSDLIETQAKDVERFQMHQLKSIAEDYKRHQDILEFRKKEICDLKKEIDKEDNGREAYLADFEKSLEKELQARQQLRNQGDGAFALASLTSEVDDPNHIELTTVDEYSPYGTAPASKSATSKKQTGRGRGRRRGAASTSGRS